MTILQLQMRKVAYNNGYSMRYADECYINLIGLQGIVATPNVASLIWDHVKYDKKPFVKLEATFQSVYSLLNKIIKEYAEHGEAA